MGRMTSGGVDLKDSNPLYFENVVLGQELPVVHKGPLTTAHIMRWSSAVENWHRIHYDAPFAQNNDGLPDVILSGSAKQQFLIEMLNLWVGETGWVWKFQLEHRSLTLPGDILSTWGIAKSKVAYSKVGIVLCEIGMKDQNQQEVCLGGATVVLGIFGIIVWMIFNTPWLQVSMQEPAQTVGEIGRLLMTHYLLPFEVASILLLAALMGAALLSRKS